MIDHARLIELLHEPFAGIAIVALDHTGDMHTVLYNGLRRFAFDVNNAVDRTGAGGLSGQRAFSRCENTVMPGRRQIDATGTVAAGSSNALRKLIDIKIRATFAVLGKLQLVETQRQLIEKRRGLFKADDSAVKGLDVVADSRISPNACSHHQSDGLTGAGVNAPKVYEERQTSEWLQKNTGKGCRKYDLRCRGHCTHLCRRFQPFGFRAVAPNRLEHGSKAGIAIEDQAVHKGGKTFVRNVPEASDAFPFGDHIIVEVFDV